MNWKEEATQRLMDYKPMRTSVTSLRRELKRLEMEATALRSGTVQMGGSGGGSREDRQLNNLIRRQELDAALEALSGVFQDMLELAQVEKTMQLLAADIEKTRRRVNALEYVMIPDLQTTIRYIAMKLDENERGNTTRLMKVKDMVLQEAHDFR